MAMNDNDKINAWSKIGYGRLEEKSMELNQTGYGTPINPETVTGERSNVSSIKNEKTITAKPVKKTVQKNKVVAPTKEERQRLKRYEEQESRRAPKIQVDQKVVLAAWVVFIGIAFISSAIVSFNGITSVAGFVGLSATWMASLFFFFVELMYLIFLIAYLVLSSRVDEDGKPEKTGGSLFGMIAFGGIAILANAFHTLDYWNWDITNPQAWAGIVLSISAPVAIISASKLASRVVFAKAISL